MAIPVILVPESITVPGEERKLSSWRALLEWIPKIARRVNKLWTGDTIKVTTNATGDATVTFKRRYHQNPQVSHIIEDSAPATNRPAMGIASWTTAGGLTTAMVIKTYNAATGANLSRLVHLTITDHDGQTYAEP